MPAADLGAAYEDVAFETSDGFELKGWYIQSKNGAAVISFPGRASSQKRAKMLADHGYGVLLFDRRGEGESEGDPEHVRLARRARRPRGHRRTCRPGRTSTPSASAASASRSAAR